MNFPKKFTHAFSTRFAPGTAFAKNAKKMELPEYFDSQAQAAAMLNMSIYEVKAAKAEGCPAFRGGRIRRREFQAWLNEPVESTSGDDNVDHDYNNAPHVSVWLYWESKTRRRQMVFGLIEYLEKALKFKQITAEQFLEVGSRTLPLVIELGRIWDAEIPEKRQARVRRKLVQVQQKLLQTAAPPTLAENGANEC